MNLKDARILKFWNDGCSVERIAKKLGTPQNIERVIQGLERCGIKAEPTKDSSNG